MTMANSKSGQWSRQHESCINCGSNNYPHVGKGLCSTCYRAQYSELNRDKVRTMKQASYLRKGGKTYSKQRREDKWFSGKRETVLNRDGYKCVKCGETQQLVVHHIDGNGRGSRNPNNSLDNLQTLCRACHAIEHFTLDKWSKDYEKCINCGTTQIKHRCNGLCIKCYSLDSYRKRNPNAKTRTKVDGQWSFEYDCCQSCGRTSIKHKAKGLCLSCYRTKRSK
jgi:5-methylcytosine-specific restriction endonuclease McrA